VHLLRAQCDAILSASVPCGGRSAAELRLPGNEARSPVRVVLDRALRIRGLRSWFIRRPDAAVVE